MATSPPSAWTELEMLRALRLYVDVGAKGPNDRAVVALAESLGRGPGSMSRRLANYQFVNPLDPGKGLSGGALRCRPLWESYGNDPDLLDAAISRLITSAPATWLFQGNPAVFDIDSYLADRFALGEPILWSVRQNASRIRPNDAVFLWRSKGKGTRAGIVAQAIVLEAPCVMPADSPGYYRKAIPEDAVRCRLRLLDLRLLPQDGMVDREEFVADPLLSSHSIVTVRTGTNFPVSEDQSRAIRRLWNASISGPEIDLAAPEGRRVLRIHMGRERNRCLVAEAKRRFRERHGRLFCEVCGFDFAKAYGIAAEGFIEAHHDVPISELDENSVTRVEDLTMRCSNCHRMIHLRRPWLSVDQLEGIVRRAAKANA